MVVEPTNPPGSTALAILRLIVPETGARRSSRAVGARSRDRFSQQQLARAVGMSPSAISRYEAGERIPSTEQARRLVGALGYPPYLLERAQSFVAWAQSARASAPARQHGDVSTRLDALAAEAGFRIEEMVRGVLAASMQVAVSGDHHRKQSPEATDPAAVANGEMTPDLPPVGDALTMLRLIRGWDRRELAQAAGLSLAAITRYEHGRTKPSLPRLQQVLAALDFPAGVYDRSLQFVGSALDARRLNLSPNPSDAWKAAARAIAADKAKAAEDFTRRELVGLAATVRLLVSRQAAPAVWALLQDCPESVRQGLVREVPEFQTVGLCELLCDLCLDGAGAAGGMHLAVLAVDVAQRAPCSEAFRSRVAGFAGIHLASCRSAVGGLPATVQDVESCLALWRAGAAEDPGLLNAARVLRLEAALRRDQHRLPESLALIDQALTIDTWGETPELQMAKARVLAELGENEAALDTLRLTVHQIDGDREPRRRHVALSLLVLNLCLLGRYAAAELLLPEIRTRAERLANQLDLLRIDWLAGKVAAGQGRTDEAIALFMRVRSQFLASENAHDAALVTLELAEVHATLGRTSDVKALARQSELEIADKAMDHEEREALAQFYRAAAEDRLTIGVLKSLISSLSRVQPNPKIRSEHPAIAGALAGCDPTMA